MSALTARMCHDAFARVGEIDGRVHSAVCGTILEGTLRMDLSVLAGYFWIRVDGEAFIWILRAISRTLYIHSNAYWVSACLLLPCVGGTGSYNKWTTGHGGHPRGTAVNCTSALPLYKKRSYTCYIGCAGSRH